MQKNSLRGGARPSPLAGRGLGEVDPNHHVGQILRVVPLRRRGSKYRQSKVRQHGPPVVPSPRPPRLSNQPCPSTEPPPG